MKIPTEPLLDPKNDRNAILPIIHSDIWAAYKQHESLIWHAHEIKLDHDIIKWEALNDDEKYFLKHILAFFANSDKLVADNLCSRFCSEVQLPEAKFFYTFQAMAENIHSETYSKLIDAYIPDKNEKDRLFNAVEHIPCIAQKSDWATKWINSDDRFAARLVAFATFEGIMFSGSFCSIYWMNERNMISGLAKANEFIARDEGLHTSFACLLYTKYIVNKLPYETVAEIITEAVDLEINFITDALPCRLLGMNSDNMIKYVKFVANRLVAQLGYPELYKGVEQPFPFMDRINLREKSNFFEEEVGAYRKFDNENKEDINVDPYEDCF